MTLSDEIKALVSTLEMQLNGFAKAAYEKDLRIAELERDLSQHKAARIAYASEFPLDEHGEPDVGNIHANIRALKAQAADPSAPAAGKLIGIEDMCQILDAAHIKPTEYTDCTILYTVTFEQLRSLYMKGMAFAPQAADTDKVREAILAMRCTNPYAEDKCNLYKEGYAVARKEAADLVASMAAQAPVREVPEVNDAKYSEAEKAIGKIIFQRYPRIKGVHCASITIGILEYMGLRHSALNYDQQERVDE